MSETRACRQSRRRCATPFSQQQASASAVCLSVNRYRACRAETLCCQARHLRAWHLNYSTTARRRRLRAHFYRNHRIRPDGLEDNGRPAAEIADCRATECHAGGAIYARLLARRPTRPTAGVHQRPGSVWPLCSVVVRGLVIAKALATVLIEGNNIPNAGP